MTPPTLSNTGCDVRCPATALVMVQKAVPLPAGWVDIGRAETGNAIHVAPVGTPPPPPSPAYPFAYLSLCGHHYHANDVLLALDGWKVVADLRTWKGPTS